MGNIYHSPATYCIRGKKHLISVATDFSVKSVHALSRDARIELSAVGTRDSFTIWQGEVLPNSSTNDLNYTLYADSCLIGNYTLPIADLNLAPLAITEISVNMKTSPTVFIEVANTTDRPINLADYKIVYKFYIDEYITPICTLPIASSDEEIILPPHELCVLWLAYASSHDPKSPCLTAEDFCARLESDFRWRKYQLDPESIRIIRVEAAEKESENGIEMWKNKPDLTEFLRIRTWDKIVICISPLNGDLENAVCRVTANDLCHSEWDWNTPVRRASLWKPDVRGGADMICTNRSIDLTPGTLAKGQVIPNLRTDRPVCIIPLDLPSTHLLADGKLNLRFLAEDAGNCTLVLNSGTRIAAAEERGVWTVAISEKHLARLNEICGYIEADGGTYITQYEFSKIEIVDNAGPEATILYPEKGYTAELGAEVKFAATYYDRSGIDTSASRLFLDGKEVVDRNINGDGNINCIFKDLSLGRHELTLELRDLIGNSSHTESHFEVTEANKLYCYRGEIHSHTGDSDGVATPEDAIIYARDVGKVDYFAVTDHNLFLSDDRYASQLEVADRYNEAGKFAVLRGWEMTWNNEAGSWGHLNVLESSKVHYDYRNMNFPALMDFMQAHPSSFGMFNHPSYKWGNFDEYAHITPEADKVMCLTEIKGDFADEEHALALTYGWHLAPVSNEDTHKYNWTTASSRYGYVLAPGLSRQNVVEAMQARRTYATSDPSLHMYFKVNGAWLGSRIDATDMLTLDICLDSDRPEGLGVLSIIGEDNITVMRWDLGALKHFEKTVEIPCEFDYYYLKLVHPDIPKDYTISAPVWIEGRNALHVSKMNISLVDGDEPNLVNVYVENKSNRIITDLRADFYLAPKEELDLSISIPYHSVDLGDLRSGETANISRTFPNLTGRRRVSVIVRGRIGGKEITATRYVLLTPVVISEILPDSSAITLKDGTVLENPFSYVVLSNRTNSVLSLDGISLRQWTETGKHPTADQIHSLDKITLPARGSVVIWLRKPDSPITADDFRSRYGADITEGKTLFIIDGNPLLSTRTKGGRLDLLYNGEFISRVHWNYGLKIGTQPTTDRALKYVYNGGETVTSALIDDNAMPTLPLNN